MGNDLARIRAWAGGVAVEFAVGFGRRVNAIGVILALKLQKIALFLS
jgi:hypothetical protein